MYLNQTVKGDTLNMANSLFKSEPRNIYWIRESHLIEILSTPL